jgi:hypothetical protein
MNDLFETLKQNHRLIRIKIYEKILNNEDINEEESLEFDRTKYLLEYYCVMNKKLRLLSEYYQKLDKELNNLTNEH